MPTKPSPDSSYSASSQAALHSPTHTFSDDYNSFMSTIVDEEAMGRIEETLLGDIDDLFCDGKPAGGAGLLGAGQSLESSNLGSSAQ